MNNSFVVSTGYIWEQCPRLGFSKENFHQFLQWAVNEIGANDIFIETNEPLGIKKDNVTHNVTKRVFSYTEISNLIKEIYQTSAAAELRRGKPFGFAYAFTYGKDERLRFRVDASAGNSVSGIDEGIELVFRPTDGEPPSVQDLGLKDKIVSVTDHKDGLVLVTGPTGSGKTTMIASLLKHVIQSKSLHVLSVEDPIEYDLKQIANKRSRVFQCELNTNVNTFTLFNKHMLRRSPDVILLGELRDAESIDAGILASQTGHLVFATGHTNDASNAIERLVDDLPSEEQKSKLLKLASTIRAVIHQRLLEKIGGGRVAVTEELYIDSVLRMEMYGVIAKGEESLTAFLQAHIATSGLSIKNSIKSKFTKGLLNIETCLAELAQQLDKNDITFFNKQCAILLNEEKISRYDYENWVELLRVYNESL